MQESLDCRVEVTISHRRQGKEDCTVFRATAYPNYQVSGEARQSVSLSAKCHSSSPAMGTAAIFRLLIALDYEVSKAWAIKQAT